MGEPAHARDQGEQQTGGQSRAMAEQPPPDQRDTARGAGHGQRRGHAQGEGRVTEDARPGMQDQVVRAQHRIHPPHRGQHLADAAVGHVPARQLVAAEQRFADPVHRQEESGQRRPPPQTDRGRLPVAVLCFAGRIAVRARGAGGEWRGARGESCQGESHSGAAARASAVTRPAWAAFPCSALGCHGTGPTGRPSLGGRPLTSPLPRHRARCPPPVRRRRPEEQGILAKDRHPSDGTGLGPDRRDPLFAI